MDKKRNLIRNFYQCLTTWSSLRRYPGLFSLPDAALNWKEVLLPRRFSYRAAGRDLARTTRIEKVSDGVSKVTVLENGLVFYWLGEVSNNLYFSIAQEFDPLYPHYYTTPPVRMTPESLVLDVGSCEGLFAYRILKQGQARKVICFEPSERTANYTRLGAETNGLSDKIVVETLAVGRISGPVNFLEGDSPEANRIDLNSSATGGRTIMAVSLDDYCAEKKINLTERDLIKIDAEGADVDILKGAERLIRGGSPQIAITTYHDERHVFEMVDWLKQVQPAYRLRLKGFFFWGGSPRPVLLQAAL
ncbi:MAG: FkbM family methyltransferase [Verrucomicrobiota bacterium]